MPPESDVQSTEQSTGPSTEAGVTTPAPEQTNKAADEVEGEATSVVEKPKRRDGGFQRRIDQLTRNNYQLEAQLRAEREARQQTQTQANPQGEPKREQFETLDSYLEAKATHAAEAAADRRLRAYQEQNERVAAERESQSLAQRWETAQETARDGIEDYDDIVSTSSAPITRAMTQAIMESDVGPRIVYHLATNPEIAERISKMTATSAAREIGKIEASVLTKIEAEKTAKPKTAETKPIAPVGAGGSASTGPSDNQSIHDWMKARQAQIAKRRGF